MFTLVPRSYFGNFGMGINPFRELEKEFQNLENEMLFSSRSMGFGIGFGTDIKEYDDRFVILSELPGFKKENISVEVRDGKLTVIAERHNEELSEDVNFAHNSEEKSELSETSETTKTEEASPKARFIRRERAEGVFSRTFEISLVDESAISASYTDGILTLTLPKKKKQIPETRKLEIN
jgi:HSP20 family protein